LRSVRALPSGRRLRARADQERACQLLVTTTFGTSTAAALSVAYDAGVDVRVLNPRGVTYHPKVYVGRRDDRVSVVVGSANLTSGLVKNVEAAVLLSPRRGVDVTLAACSSCVPASLPTRTCVTAKP
jgi:hypothetical protein